MIIYSIYDKKSQSYKGVHIFDNDIIAFRQLKSLIFKECDNNRFFKEEDFEIVRIGSYYPFKAISDLPNVNNSPIESGFQILDSKHYETLMVENAKSRGVL